MIKKVIKKGVLIVYDTENVKEIFAVNNAVYALEFPSDKIYIGSCKDLSSRIIQHCSNSSNSVVKSEINRYKKFKLTVVDACNRIDEAREIEKKIIHKFNKSSNIINKEG